MSTKLEDIVITEQTVDIFNNLVKYYNSLVGLTHISVKTKAIYHAFVEELELREINYDIMLYNKERMLSYNIKIITINNKLTVLKTKTDK